MTMTNDDYVLTAHNMGRKAKKQLEIPRGSFMHNYWTAVAHLAEAYYHADSNNQSMMRRQFDALWQEFNTARQEPPK